MRTTIDLIWRLRVWEDNRGQDLIEYALIAGIVALSAGALVPSVAISIGQVFSKTISVLNTAWTIPVSQS